MKNIRALKKELKENVYDYNVNANAYNSFVFFFKELSLSMFNHEILKTSLKKQSDEKQAEINAYGKMAKEYQKTLASFLDDKNYCQFLNFQKEINEYEKAKKTSYKIEMIPEFKNKTYIMGAIIMPIISQQTKIMNIPDNEKIAEFNEKIFRLKEKINNIPNCEKYIEFYKKEIPKKLENTEKEKNNSILKLEQLKSRIAKCDNDIISLRELMNVTYVKIFNINKHTEEIKEKINDKSNILLENNKNFFVKHQQNHMVKKDEMPEQY